MIDIENLENIMSIEKLPIFRMSLSSKELFHSNFIAWVMEEYPEIMGKFFCEILEIENEIKSIENVKREKHDIDISFNLGENIILIENKVKSIAYEEQLKKYQNLYKKEENKKYILLSLKKPTFENDEWLYLEYSTLLTQFENMINKEINPYHKYLLTDYINFINILLKNFLPLINIEEIEICNLYKKGTDENNLIEKLTTLRMHDFFLKGLFEDMANLLINKPSAICNNEEFKFSNKKIFDCEENIFSITFSMSRAQGLLDVKYKIGDFIIGIQIQGEQYRQFIEGEKKEKIKDISKKLLESKQWFQFSNQLDKTEELTYPIKGEFNKFNSSNWLFLYRSIKINIANEALFDMIYKDIKYIKSIKRDG